jgi:hypothetical protein
MSLSAGAVRFKNSVIDRLHLTRLQSALLFGIVALLLFFPLIYLGATPIPFERGLTKGTAKLYLSTTNMRMVFPNQCVGISWNVEGIQTIAINGEGKVGTGVEQI